eukprot:m.256710 g.256710  ORF g.256710 m.256710 type:complete len:311 (+) comp19174_c0_seq11:366-1298(+)
MAASSSFRFRLMKCAHCGLDHEYTKLSRRQHLCGTCRAKLVRSQCSYCELECHVEAAAAAAQTRACRSCAGKLQTHGSPRPCSICNVNAAFPPRGGGVGGRGEGCEGGEDGDGAAAAAPPGAGASSSSRDAAGTASLAASSSSSNHITSSSVQGSQGSQQLCSHCTSSQYRYGPPVECQQCHKTRAFERPQADCAKTDGKTLCLKCSLAYQRSKVAQKKKGKRREPTADRSTPPVAQTQPVAATSNKRQRTSEQAATRLKSGTTQVRQVRSARCFQHVFRGSSSLVPATWHVQGRKKMRTQERNTVTEST